LDTLTAYHAPDCCMARSETEGVTQMTKTTTRAGLTSFKRRPLRWLPDAGASGKKDLLIVGAIARD